jgi:hypothetical protein
MVEPWEKLMMEDIVNASHRQVNVNWVGCYPWSGNDAIRGTDDARLSPR